MVLSFRRNSGEGTPRAAVSGSGVISLLIVTAGKRQSARCCAVGLQDASSGKGNPEMGRFEKVN